MQKSKQTTGRVKTYILDTNVYGEVLIEPNSEKIIEKIRTNKAMVIYGIDVIEKEINETPEHVRYKGELTKKSLIEIYNSLVDETIKISPLAKYLAEEYFRDYKDLTKSKNNKEKYKKENLKNDFLIIAIASLNSIDIVVSSDKRTMLSELSAKVYGKINKKNILRTPRLLEYKDFKEDCLK